VENSKGKYIYLGESCCHAFKKLVNEKDGRKNERKNDGGRELLLELFFACLLSKD